VADADMSQSALPAAQTRLLNVPNAVTVARLILAVILFVLLTLQRYPASLAIFLLAAGTDWVDGYWARKYGQITQLGRILDPFADKLIVCGAYIFLAAAPQLADGRPATGIAAWVAVLIMAREIMVTALRSFVESHGGDFSAKWVGKWKMVFQCAAAAFGIGQMMWYNAESRTLVDLPDWVSWGLNGTLWIAIVLTVWSGIGYVTAAWSMIREA
jgi:CDP-diacylglycerol--glycerol-3-phosphate 3-phosphatidyltransferase